MRFWAAFVLLAPLLWLQGRWARWRTPRLLPALENGQTGGEANATALKLLVVGESPAVGVGVSCAAEALPAQIANALAQQTGRACHWQVIGENGARMQRLLELTRQPPASAADCIVVVTGVNDCTGLTTRSRWRKQLLQLVQQLRLPGNRPIIFTAVPPVHSFTALPQPLRWVIGQRAKQLNADMQNILHPIPGAYCATVLPSLSAQQLAADGFHPSASACSEWGHITAEVIRPLLS
ncbi:MAG: SGNH/GDSL hydrolase family protein [Nevskiales bacterium]